MALHCWKRLHMFLFVVQAYSLGLTCCLLFSSCSMLFNKLLKFVLAQMFGTHLKTCYSCFIHCFFVRGHIPLLTWSTRRLAKEVRLQAESPLQIEDRENTYLQIRTMCEPPYAAKHNVQGLVKPSAVNLRIAIFVYPCVQSI